MKKIIISLLVAFGLTTSSYAVSLEGFSFGASVATGGFYAVGTERDDNDVAGTDNDTKEAGAFQEDFASIFVEYNLGGVSVGLDYIPGTIETPENKNLQVIDVTGVGDATATNTAKAEFENHTTVYAIIPLPLGGLYAKVGGIYVDINTLEILGTGGSYEDTDTTGITAGLGWSHEAADGVSVRLEALAAQYDDVTLTNQNNTTTSVLVEDMMSASARISLVKSF